MDPSSPLVLRLEGELTLPEAPHLRGQLMDAVVDSDAPAIVLDLSAVTFVDSTAIGVILAARKRLALKRRDLRLAAPQRQVLRTLKLMGLHNVLAIHSTLAEACDEG